MDTYRSHACTRFLLRTRSLNDPLFSQIGISNFSVALLQIDLERDPFILLVELLHGICHDFARQPHCDRRSVSDTSDHHTTGPPSASTQISSLASPHPNHLIVARLNVLVLLSNRFAANSIASTHHNHSTTRSCILRAVFYVLRMVLWSRNRSVRCASLRCLRYYLRSVSDVHLFLESQLDFMVARCLDLSYAPEPNSSLTRAVAPIPHGLLDSTYENAFGFGLSPGQLHLPYVPCTQIPENGEASGDHQVAWSRKPIHPKLRQSLLPRSSRNPGPVTFAFNSSNHSLATSMPASAERHSFLRLAYHLVRLAPHLFPSSLIQAVAAPCLRAGRLASSCRRDPLNKKNLRDTRHTQAFPLLTNYRVDADALVDSCALSTRDVAVRSGLLILSELGSLSHLNPMNSSRFLSYIGLLNSFQRSHPYISSAACAKLFLLTMLQSWPGLSYFLNTGLSCLQTIMHNLTMGTTEMRNLVLDLLFSLFPSLPTLHPSIEHLEAAILSLTEALATQASSTLPVFSSRASSTQPQSTSEGVLLPQRQLAWDITGGFVATEGCLLFPHWALLSGSTIDLVQCHSALLLATLIQAGVCEGLIRAISDVNEATSTRAGLLLGFISYKSSTLLPYDHPTSRRVRRVCETLQPCNPSNRLAVLWLDRVHRVMRSHDLMRSTNPANFVRVPLHSPFLECLAHPTAPHRPNELNPTTVSSHSHLLQVLETWIDQLIFQSNVIQPIPLKSSISNRPSTPPSNLIMDVDQWDWDSLLSLGRYLFDLRSTISWEEHHRMDFLHRVMEFITPPTEWFSKCPHDKSSVEGVCATAGKLSPLDASNLVSTMDAASARCFRKDKNSTPISQRQRSFSAITSGAPGVNFSLPDSSWTSGVLRSNLALLSRTWHHASSAAILMTGLILHLALYPTTCEPGRLLTKFLSAIRETLSASLDRLSSRMCAPSEDVDVFHPNRLADSCSGLLFLALGRLTSNEAGEAHLESSGLCPLFLRLFTFPAPSNEKHVVHRSLLAKLLLSSLDFTRSGGLSQKILTAAVESDSKSIQLYTVQLMRLLLRLRTPLDCAWYLDLISKLCFNLSLRVSHQALQLLEETCSNPVCLRMLTSLVLRDPSSGTPTALSDLLTPLGFRLLGRTSGPIGHRIFGHILSHGAAFHRIASCTLKPVDRTVSPTHLNLQSGESQAETLIDWMLNAARSSFNLAYVLELDNRLNGLFIPSMSRPRLSIQPSDEAYEWLRLHCCDSACPSRAHLEDSDNNDDDSFSLDDLYRPSNQDFGFLESAFNLTETSTHSLFVKQHGAPRHRLADDLFSLPIPVHLYGCLAVHEAGFQLLVSRGDLETLLGTLNASVQASVKQPSGVSSSYSRNPPSVLETKAALWALAHVCSSGFGRTWLAQQKKLVGSFKLLATEAPCVGVRTTAWLCLNLITFKLGGGAFAELASPPSTDAACDDGCAWIASDGFCSTSARRPAIPLTNTIDHGNCGDFAQSATGTVFSVSQVSHSLTSTLPNGMVYETATAVYSSAPTVAGKPPSNSSKFLKVLTKYGSSSSRSRRWFVRRDPPWRKQLSSPPLGLMSSVHLCDSALHQAADLPVKIHSGAGDLSAPTTHGPHPNATYESATWTHGNPVLLNSIGRQSSNPECDLAPSIPALATTILTPYKDFGSLLANPVCLPVDLCQLGFRTSPSQSTCCLSSRSCEKRMSSLSTLLSFVRVSSSAQSLLKHCNSLWPSAPQDGSMVETAHSKMDNGTPRFVSPVSSLRPAEIKSEHPYAGSTKPSSAFNCSSKEVQRQLASHNNACPSLDDTSPPTSFFGHPGAPFRCISRRCRREDCASVLPTGRDSTVSETASATTTITHESWKAQLVDVVTCFLSSMFSGAHERALNRLVCIATTAQSQGDVGCCSDSPEPLFDACAYAHVAHLLATYTFPLESRAKIQSALSRLRMDELLLDAKDAVTELEEAVRALCPSASVDPHQPMH
ncbi:unnamed protein product [Dicrocoelium dendriticum]|nr:unnamed protein product [Dicrocoelium dendriticum]